MTQTEHDISFAYVTAHVVATVLSNYCKTNERETGHAYPLDLPVELRERIQFAVDATSDLLDEANRCLPQREEQHG